MVVPDRTPAAPEAYAAPPAPMTLREFCAFEPRIQEIHGPRPRPPPASWQWIEPPKWIRKREFAGYVLRGTSISGSGSSTAVAAGAISSTAGDTMLAVVKDESTRTLNSFTSSTGDSASILGPWSNPGSNVRIYIVYKISITGNASDVWTANWSGTSSFTEIAGTTVSGIGSYVTNHNNGADSGTAQTSGTVATSNAYAFLFAGAGLFNTGTWTWTSGFEGSTSGPGPNSSTGYKIQDRTGTYGASATCSTNDAWTMTIAEFAPAGGVSAPTIWKQGQGAVAASTTSINVAYPGGLESGNLIVLVIVSKHANNPGTPSGFALVDSTNFTDGSGTGADTGEVRLSVYTKTSDGTETGTLTVSKTTETGTGIQGQMFRFVSSQASSETWSLAGKGGTDATTGTGVSVTASADPGFATNDMCVSIFGDVSDVGTSTWTLTPTATGATFATPTLMSNTGTTQGDDMRLVACYSFVTGGPSSAAPVISGTANGSAGNSHRGCGVVLRLRQASGTQALSGTSPSSSWGQAGTLTGAGAVALAGTPPFSAWAEAGILAAVSAPLAGASPGSSWGQGGAISGAGAAALSGAPSLSTWGEAGTLSPGPVALAGASSSSLWGEDGTLSVAGGPQALSGPSPTSLWGQDGSLAPGPAALSGAAPASSWHEDGALAPAGAADLDGIAPFSAWGEDGDLAAITAALAGSSPFSTWGEAGTLGFGSTPAFATRIFLAFDRDLIAMEFDADTNVAFDADRIGVELEVVQVPELGIEFDEDLLDVEFDA